MARIKQENQYRFTFDLHLPIIGYVFFEWEPLQKKTFVVLDENYEEIKSGFGSYQEAESWCQDMGFKVLDEI